MFATTFSSNGLARPNDVEAASATIATRVDGINYFQVETLGLALGSGNDTLNIQGTTATTNVSTGAGDDRILVSSNANAGVDTPVDFLTGHLRDINGALNVDAGKGANQIMISNEASTLDNSDIVISDVLTAGEPAGAEIAVRGLTGGNNAFGWVDPAQATITFRADTTVTGGIANGSFANGVSIWTASAPTPSGSTARRIARACARSRRSEHRPGQRHGARESGRDRGERGGHPRTAPSC